MKKPEEILASAKALSDKLSEKAGTIIPVHPRCYTLNSEDQAICFIREPNYDEMAYAFEKMSTGQAIDGAEAIFDRCAIREESDPRFFDKANAKLRLSAVASCILFVKGYDDEIKKKSDTIPVR